MDVSVRRAGPGDIAAFVASVAGLFREDGGQHDPSMSVDWPDQEGIGYYGSLVDDDACLLLVACAGDRVIGHLVGKLSEPSSLRAQRFAVLESMRVEPGSRRAGVGGLLVRHFLDWARERDARQASVTAFAANDAAQRFYRRHGFAPMSVTLRAAL